MESEQIAEAIVAAITTGDIGPLEEMAKQQIVEVIVDEILVVERMSGMIIEPGTYVMSAMLAQSGLQKVLRPTYMAKLRDIAERVRASYAARVNE